MNRDRINRAIEACYDAVFDPNTWPDALHQLARSADAVCAMFYPENPSGRLKSVPASRDYGDFLEDYIRGGWYDNHYRAERGWPLLKSGHSVVVEHDLATDEERRHLRHYNDLYLKWGFPGFAMIGFRLDGQDWALPLLRAASQGHFSHEDAKVLASLAPHFRRMIRLSEQRAVDRAVAGLEALEVLGGAAIVIGCDGRVVGMNAAAELLVGKGLTVAKGFLDTSDKNARTALYEMIFSTRTMGLSAEPASPVVIRRADTMPLVLEAFPARGLLADAFRQTGALILISDLSERPGPGAIRLQTVLGLTGAEARLANRICEGHELTEVADEFKISIHTARSQTKSILEKTNTHRQAEFITLAQRLGYRSGY